jgi:hypothetical protein
MMIGLRNEIFSYYPIKFNVFGMELVTDIFCSLPDEFRCTIPSEIDVGVKNRNSTPSEFLLYLNPFPNSGLLIETVAPDVGS